MKLPPAISDPAFRNFLNRGLVFRSLEDQLSDPNRAERYKYGVLLNAAFDGTDLFYAFTTSSLQFYSNGLHDADIVRIPLNSYPFFPKETVINLRDILQVTQARLEARYSNGELRFEGELSSPHISEVDRKIRASRLLSPRMKNRILP